MHSAQNFYLEEKTACFTCRPAHWYFTWEVYFNGVKLHEDEYELKPDSSGYQNLTVWRLLVPGDTLSIEGQAKDYDVPPVSAEDLFQKGRKLRIVREMFKDSGSEEITALISSLGEE